MADFETEMLKFAKPLFDTRAEAPVNVLFKQMRVFGVWAMLITMLAEYIDKSGRRVSVYVGAS
jgi:hypothetical protein